MKLRWTRIKNTDPPEWKSQRFGGFQIFIEYSKDHEKYFARFANIPAKSTMSAAELKQNCQQMLDDAWATEGI